MEVEPNDLLLFARIVEAGSFSQAATRVNLPKSTVSRRISLLEARLGERLLQRTTRKLVVTEFGASLHDCMAIKRHGHPEETRPRSPTWPNRRPPMSPAPTC